MSIMIVFSIVSTFLLYLIKKWCCASGWFSFAIGSQWEMGVKKNKFVFLCVFFFLWLARVGEGNKVCQCPSALHVLLVISLPLISQQETYSSQQLQPSLVEEGRSSLSLIWSGKSYVSTSDSYKTDTTSVSLTHRELRKAVQCCYDKH